MIKRERLPIVFLAMLCLLSGLWSGLSRIGWDIYVLPVTAHHGAVMVGGFLGTLIALEKIIPLKKKELYIIPVLNAISVFFFFVRKPGISIALLITSSAALVFVFYHYFRTQRKIIYVLMLLGAVSWLTGNILLMTRLFYPLAFPWWTAFALFIITAERLEVMTFLPVGKSHKIVLVTLLLGFIVGILFSFHGTGSLICGLSLTGASLWLMRHDLIGVNIKKQGLHKFMAVTLLTGYIALLMTGVFFFALSEQWLTYDALVHSFFIGFVFSMIFAHGPIILPGILGITATPFSRILYLWLGLLQASWLVRFFADVTLALEIREISGLLSVVAILGYFATIAVLTVRSRQHAEVL
jgi:hypothetical protein